MGVSNTRSADGPGASLPVADIHNISSQQLEILGLQRIAYVKTVVLNGKAVYAVHAADGMPMAIASEREIAIAAILENGMLPALVH